MIDKQRERREWDRTVADLIRDLEENPDKEPTPEPVAEPLSPLVVDCGMKTTPEDRAAIQAYEDRITALDRRDRGW